MRSVRRRNVGILLALLAGAGLVLLFLPGDARDDETSSVSRDDGGEEASRPLRREAAPGADGPAPTLAGRGEVPADEPVHGPVVVHVTGPGAEPLAGVRVVPSGGALSSPFPETDAQGRASFDDVPYDGSVLLRFHLPRLSGEIALMADWTQLRPWGGGPDGLAAEGPDVRFMADTGLRLDVECVEAESGRRLAGLAAEMSTAEGVAQPRVLGPDAFLVFPPSGKATTLSWRTEPPPGRMVWEDARCTATVSPYTTALRLVHPLRLERTAFVTVEESDGSAALSAIRWVRVAGRTLPASAVRRDTQGVFRIDGIPHLPGELLAVEAYTVRTNRRGAAAATVTISDDPREELEARVRLPPLTWRDLDGGYNSTIGIGGGAGGAFAGRRGHRTNLPAAAVGLEVRRRDGRPAVGALVTIGGRRHWTDHLGRVRVVGLPPGRHAVQVSQLGLMPITASVVAVDGEEVHLRLEEPAPAMLDVEVVDERGLPLSFATLTVRTPSGQPWIDLQDGVQRLDPFTDHEGRRTLNNLEPGTLQVTAAWGSRRREVQVAARADEVAHVRIELPRPGAAR